MVQIKNEIQYKAACERINELLKVVNNNTPADDKNLLELDLISDLVADYEQKIEKFFDRLDFTPPETTAWVGENAILYSNTIIQDKPEFLDYGEKIKDLAKEMQDIATNLDDTIQKNEQSCEYDDVDDSYQTYW